MSGEGHAGERQFSRRDFLKLATTGVAGVGLMGTAGCGGEGSSSQSNGKVKLQWWDYWSIPSQVKGQKALLKRYMKTHPAVTAIDTQYVPFANMDQKLLQGAIAGKVPDIAQIDDASQQSLAATGLCADITDQIKSWGQVNEFLKAPWEICRLNGKYYGVPWTSNCLVLWYDKDALKKAGVKPPKDWGELKEAARKLTTSKRSGLALSAIHSEEGTFQWLPFLWQSGADIPNIDSPGGRAALQLWVDMFRDGSISHGALNWTQPDVAEQFIHRRTAMMINGPWEIPSVKEGAPDLNWGVALLPKGKQRASIYGGENLMITTGSKYPGTDWDLIRWIKEPENDKFFQKLTGNLPSRKSELSEDYWQKDPVRSVFAQQLLVAKPRAYGPKYAQISNVIQDAMQSAITGQNSVAVALSQAQKEITPLLPEPMRKK